MEKELINSILELQERKEPYSYLVSESELKKGRGRVKAVVAHNQNLGYIILKGSIIANEPTSLENYPNTYNLWIKLKKEGYLVDNLFVKNYNFGKISQSAIARIVFLASRNNAQAFTVCGEKENKGQGKYLKAEDAIKKILKIERMNGNI
jgi:hypothetical protein